MGYQKSMNNVIEYIESNLSEHIEYSIAAKLLNCSEWEFRRIFSILAQIPISEYIRRRRLSLAVNDIKNGKKIIDIAMCYGYESTSAFSRAFHNFFGIAPSSVRKNDIELKLYPRLTFKLILMEGIRLGTNQRTNIIGAGEVNYAVSVEKDDKTIQKTNNSFWNTKGNVIMSNKVTVSLPTVLGCGLSNLVSHHFKERPTLNGRGHAADGRADSVIIPIYGVVINQQLL